MISLQAQIRPVSNALMPGGVCITSSRIAARKGWLIGLTVAMFSLASVGPLDADEAPLETPPLVAVTYASLDRLLEDADHLLTLADAGPDAHRLQGILNFCNTLQGIDRQQPLAVMIFTDSAAGALRPVPLIAIPLSDIVALETTIAATGNQLSITSDPREFQLLLGKDQLQLTVEGGYGFITKPEQPVSAGALPAALRHLEVSRPQVDLAIHLQRAGLPAHQIDELRNKLNRDAERELQPNDSETDEEFRLRADFQRALFDLAELVISEGEELSATVTLQPDAPVEIVAQFRALQDGALQDWLQAVLTTPRRLATASAVDSAFRLQLAFELTGRGRDLAHRMTSLVRRNILQELAAAPPDLLDQVVRACDAFDATAATGRLETRLEFLPTPAGKMVLLAAAALSQPDAIDGFLRAALPLAQQSGDLQAVTIDAVRLRGIHFHEVMGVQLRERDRKLYGPSPALYLAADRDALWVALGSSDTAAILAALFQPEELETLPKSSASLTLRLLPWVELAASAGSQPAKAALPMIRDLLSSTATIRADLNATQSGLELQVQADEAYVSLLTRLIALRAKRP
ncbi:MAG: hypothetical protein ACK5Q5_17190 [Planctomycetaceae bacterium]